MMRRHPLSLTLALGLLGVPLGCSDSTPGGGDPEGIHIGTGGCATSADCAADEVCLHGRCAERVGGHAPTTPTLASLRAAPQTLEFASVPPGARKTLEVVLANDGAEVVTLEVTEVISNGTPTSVERFSIESMGTGPFWIRPGRQRSIFVTYTGDGAGPHGASLAITSAAAPVRVELRGE